MTGDEGGLLSRIMNDIPDNYFPSNIYINAYIKSDHNI